MEFEKSLELFLERCRAKNLSVKTVGFYEICINVFFKYANENGYKEVEVIDKQFLISYFSKISRKYASATIKGRYLALNVFF